MFRGAEMLAVAYTDLCADRLTLGCYYGIGNTIISSKYL